MAWDFSTEPEFQEQLDWMREVVRERIWPLETLIDELGFDGLKRAIAPLARGGQRARAVGGAPAIPSSAARDSARSSSG